MQLKPFGGRDLSSDQKNFNNRVSRARKCVECVFGIANSKWRLLSKCTECNVNLTEKIVKCICVLHNIIIDKEVIDQNLTPVHTTHLRQNRVNHPTNEVMDIRNIYVDYFSHDTLL